MFDIIFVKPLANLLFLIYSVIPGHDFGVAVIILTILIRLALWPLLAKQLHSQKKLQSLQPEIAKVKANAKGDKQAESAALMELYREKEINPLASCLPLLVQFPFLIGLFIVFSKSSLGVEHFQQYLYEPIKNLSHMKEILANPSLFSPTLFGVVDLAAKKNIILAIIAGATQFWQVKQISPKVVDKSDPNAATQRMMTWIFPVLTGYIGYTVVAALPLYWAVSNLVSITQQSLTMREEVDKMEEAEVVKTTVRTSGDGNSSTKKLNKASKSKSKKRGKA